MRYIRLHKVNVDILIIFVFLISYVLGVIEQLIMAYLAVLIHEAAHAVLGTLYGCKIESVYFLSFGTRIDLEISVESRLKKIIIYMAGPLINFIIAFFLLFIIKENKSFLNIFFVSNIFLGAFNLLPLKPLDGGEILSVFTSSKYGIFYSQKISNIIYHIIIVSLMLISLPVAFLWRNFSILIITVFLLFKDRKNTEAAFENARNLYYRRAKLLRKGYYGVREIVVLERLTLGEAFKLMDFDQYHIIIILNDSMKITGRCTESELLVAINDHGYSFTFKDLVNLSGSDFKK